MAFQAKTRHWIGLAAIAGLCALAFVSAYRPYGASDEDVEKFAGLVGPTSQTRVLTPKPATIAQYDEGAPSRLALLVTQDDSAWLSLVHGLESVGVPVRVTTDVDAALGHQVVIVYPILSGRVLDTRSLQAIANHARKGGTVIAPNVLGGGLPELFGIETVVSERSRARIVLQEGHPDTEPYVGAGERILPIAKPGTDVDLGTNAYVPNDNGEVLAKFEDGTAAIVQRRYPDGGRTVGLGFDLGFLLQRAHGRRLEGVAPQYANGYSPTMDVLLRLVKQMYRHGEPLAVTLGVVPEARPLAVVFSHDIDYNRSIVNAVEYARAERQRGFSGTHFIQAKYVRDWNDESFLNLETAQHLHALKRLGMEVASHSVSHSLVFSKFPLGTGDEAYPAYRPFVRSAEETVDASILGELRVSRYLLEKLAPGVRVESFRPGHLEYPNQLPESLAATGYRFSSSMTANVALTHLPFRLTHAREGRAPLPVFEFPITVEDELPPALPNRLADTIALAGNIARHGGIFVVLIHPDITGPKLEFQNAVADALAGRAWFGSLRELGEWWLRRDAVVLDALPTGDGSAVLTFTAPDGVAGLPLEFPEQFVLAVEQGTGIEMNQLRPGLSAITAEPGTYRLLLRPE